MHAPLPLSTASLCKRSRAGFTLIELLLVLGVVALLAGLGFAALDGGSRGPALRTAQSTLANALTATRNRALARGVHVALAVHDDPADPARYRRLLAVVESIETAPAVVAVLELPRHIYVLPHRSRFPEVLRAAGDWRGRSSGNLLGSTRFLNANGVIHAAIASAEPARWEYALVTPRGTMSGGGALIVGLAEMVEGSFPIRFASPEQVRGLMVSSYGLARMIDGPEGF